MALQNRVNPFGTLCAVVARGTMMGNRGGRIHAPATKSLTRRWASKRWICCDLIYKDWRRPVMGAGYTEIFFLDEVTALAGGHRRCAFCRRDDFVKFSNFWCVAVSGGVLPKADDMDMVLHRERAVSGKGAEPISQAEIRALPNGAIIVVNEQAYAMRHGLALPWSFEGYGEPLKLNGPHDANTHLLTPAALVKTLKAGYQPRWHISAGV